MKRSAFIKRGATGLILPLLINRMPLQAMSAFSMAGGPASFLDNDRVLVIIQLNGGNDGLNMIIPKDQYSRYQAARGNIALPENKLLALDRAENIGLHPAMVDCQSLFNEGKLGLIQAVGYPKPSFSHFRSTDIWMSASDSDKILNTGWAGRYLDTVFPDFPAGYPSAGMPDPLAIQVGSVISPAFQGPAFMMGLAISNPSNFYQLLDDKPAIDPDTRWGEQLAYIETMSLKTDQYASVIKAAALKVTKQSPKYPDKNQLADQLKIVARLIAGGLRTKLYMVNMGSFDTHARQTDVSDNSSGTHAALLKRLSEAIGAFMDDLNILGVADRVMGMTFSEFGRRIKSNASGGTDHGAAAPVLYFGQQVKTNVVGKNPILPALATVNDNIEMQHDFRAVYASFLQQWLQLDPINVERVLGGVHPLLPIV